MQYLTESLFHNSGGRLIPIRASRVGCDTLHVVNLPTLAVSIHAPRVGCDVDDAGLGVGHAGFNPRIPCGMRCFQRFAARLASQFQSTHPVWDATIKPDLDFTVGYVSIHAPRMGCDTGRSSSSWLCWKFQSTHPVWDATAWKLTVDGQWCSCRFAPTCSSCCYFQVRSFYSNDVNVLNSRLYENRWSAGNFL